MESKEPSLPAVRCIAWLDGLRAIVKESACNRDDGKRHPHAKAESVNDVTGRPQPNRNMEEENSHARDKRSCQWCPAPECVKKLKQHEWSNDQPANQSCYSEHSY